MDKKQKKTMLIIFGVIAVILHGGHRSDLGNTQVKRMKSSGDQGRGAPRREQGRTSSVLRSTPGLAAGFVVTGILTVAALIIRIFVIPKFTLVPGKFQLVLEVALVGYFDSLSKTNSPQEEQTLGSLRISPRDFTSLRGPCLNFSAFRR